MEMNLEKQSDPLRMTIDTASPTSITAEIIMVTSMKSARYKGIRPCQGAVNNGNIQKNYGSNLVNVFQVHGCQNVFNSFGWDFGAISRNDKYINL